MKAILRRTRISPKKANLVAGTVRGKKVTDALTLLKFMPKKGAKILYKVLHSAASNAKANYKQSIDSLIVTKVLVTKGPTYKRSLPISRGRVHPINKRTSHITVEVGLPEVEAAPMPTQVATPKSDQKDTDKAVEKKAKTVKKESAKKETAPKKEAKQADAKK